MSLYARDPRGETSAFDALVVAQRSGVLESGVRREVFPSGGTAWGDDRAGLA